MTRRTKNAVDAALIFAAWAATTWLLNFARGAEVRPPARLRDSATDGKAALAGLGAFTDPRLSDDGTVSCMTCHDPAKGWSDGKRLSDGVRGGKTTRNAQTIVNAGFQEKLFHDGRADHLEGQAQQPIENVNEMGAQTFRQAARRLAAIPYHRQKFREAFGRDLADEPEDLLRALAAYQRTVRSTDAPIDDAVRWEYADGKWWFTKVDLTGFDHRLRRGMDLFFGAGRCSQCHAGPDYRVGTRPGEVDFACTGVARRFGSNDRGRGAVTGRASDDGKFKVPTLREVARTAPYFHAGQAQTLAAAVDHYRNLPRDEPNLDPRLAGISLSDRDVVDLVAFVRYAFAGRNYPEVAPPVGMLESKPEPNRDAVDDDGGRGGGRARPLRNLVRRRR